MPNIKYYPLVNKLQHLLQIKDSLAKEYFDDATHSFLIPFITVAREPGSGGAPIARAIADKLGYEYVDEQIIDDIARSVKKRKAAIEALDEKSRTAVDNVVHSLLNVEYIDDTTFSKELVKVILSYAYKGRTVILGRGANYVTPFARGLHVNIIAPYDIRVQRAIDFEGHTRVKAKEVIAEVEKERQEFVKKYFHKDLTKHNAYDITLNTQFFRVDEARDVVIAALYKKFSRSLPGKVPI